MAREHSSTCPICCARVLKTEETTDGYELSGALSSIGFPKLQSARQCGAYELTTVLGLGADNAMSVPRRAANVVSTARATGLSLTSFSDRSLAALPQRNPQCARATQQATHRRPLPPRFTVSGGRGSHATARCENSSKMDHLRANQSQRSFLANFLRHIAFGWARDVTQIHTQMKGRVTQCHLVSVPTP